jgi:EmrB/QacA subfamily drug resistance transporter
MEELNQKRWRILHIINLGTFMSTLDVGIVNIALPTMAGQFQVSLSQIQWIVTAYLLTMVALLPVMGKISDRFDRGNIYVLGFCLFTLGSLLIAFSQGFWSIIVSRCIQGLGATMIMANSQAMVRKVFTNEERGKALGINAVIISIGTLSGPAIGGIVLEYFNWTILFLINVPFGIVAVILGFLWFPKVENNIHQKIDVIGAVGLASSISLLLLFSVYVQEYGFTSTVITMLLFGVVILVGLLYFESKIAHGIIDKDLFSNRIISTGNASGFMLHMVQMATLISTTFYMQESLGFSTSKTGIMLALQPIFMGITAPLAGWYRDRFGAFIPLLIGPIMCSLSLIFVLFLSGLSQFGLALHMIFFGVGMGLFQAINSAEIMSATPLAKISSSGSMLALIRYLGMIIGIGLATALVGNIGMPNYDQEKIVTSITYLFAICFVSCFVVIGLTFLREGKKSIRNLRGKEKASV